MSTEVGISPGDVLRIERRYVVDGQLTCVTDQGRFQRVESIGSSEHIVIKDLEKKEVRMFPLHAIAEITLVHSPRRKGKKGPVAEGVASLAPVSWDPSVA